MSDEPSTKFLTLAEQAAYDEMQAEHEERQVRDPEHDRIDCVCCCWDCHETDDFPGQPGHD